MISAGESGQPLRVEFTILDDKLYREDVQFGRAPTPYLLHAIKYADAVSPPFPSDGKNGLSILVGRLEQFRKPEVPLLWGLEKKRNRSRLAVVTNLRGKDFMPSLRELESSLSDPTLLPLSFLRRRKKEWDSLDFYSSGESPSMEGAALRLKRLKQRGWEALVDRLTLVDPDIKKLYFETLHVERDQLQQCVLNGMRDNLVTGMVGIAGQCLQKEHLALLLTEDMNSKILSSLNMPDWEADSSCDWVFLGKRSSAAELLFLARGEQWLAQDQVLRGQCAADERGGELLVSKVLQRIQQQIDDTVFTVVRVKVEWRYRPEREIPILWSQKSISPAGSTVPHG